MEKHHAGLKKSLFLNFMGGVAWGLGATIGAALIITLLGFIMSKVNLVPVVGSFVAEVIKFVLQNNPQLVK
jgi:hypothetical protein